MTFPFVSRRQGLRSLAVLVAAVSLAPAFTIAISTAAGAATLDEIKKRGYMIVATEDDYKPFEFIQDGKPAGLDADLLAAFARRSPSRSSRRSSRGPGCSPASAPASTTSP
jgi:polar amino acid transport system substrate-binding protein